MSSCFACSTNQNDNESEGENEMRPLQGTTYIQLNASSYLKHFTVNIDSLQPYEYYKLVNAQNLYPCLNDYNKNYFSWFVTISFAFQDP